MTVACCWRGSLADQVVVPAGWAGVAGPAGGGAVTSLESDSAKRRVRDLFVPNADAVAQGGTNRPKPSPPISIAGMRVNPFACGPMRARVPIMRAMPAMPSRRQGR